MKITRQALWSSLSTARLNGLFIFLSASATKHGLPLSFVLAVASRETNIQNIAGDGGHGRGVLQIDDRYHAIARTTDFHAHPEILIDYGCGLLRTNLDWARKKWPKYTANQHLKIAAAAYNAGEGGASKGALQGNCDLKTTDHDYGADVLSRMAAVDSLLK